MSVVIGHEALENTHDDDNYSDDFLPDEVPGKSSSCTELQNMNKVEKNDNVLTFEESNEGSELDFLNESDSLPADPAPDQAKEKFESNRNLYPPCSPTPDQQQLPVKAEEHIKSQSPDDARSPLSSRSSSLSSSSLSSDYEVKVPPVPSAAEGLSASGKALVGAAAVAAATEKDHLPAAERAIDEDENKSITPPATQFAAEDSVHREESSHPGPVARPKKSTNLTPAKRRKPPIATTEARADREMTNEPLLLDSLVEAPAVPRTESDLQRLLKENEELWGQFYQQQRSRHQKSPSAQQSKQMSKKESVSHAVREAVLMERVIQILKLERKDLKARRDGLRTQIKEQKSALRYRDLVEEAKKDIIQLNEEHRDLCLDIRCNEKLLLMNEKLIDSGESLHRLEEEMRAANVILQRTHDHVLRDADEAEKQHHSLVQRIAALEARIDACRGSGTSPNYEQLCRLRQEAERKRRQIKSLKFYLQRAASPKRDGPTGREVTAGRGGPAGRGGLPRGGRGSLAHPRPRTPSCGSPVSDGERGNVAGAWPRPPPRRAANVERGYLTERVAEMRAELARRVRAGATAGSAGGGELPRVVPGGGATSGSPPGSPVGRLGGDPDDAAAPTALQAVNARAPVEVEADRPPWLRPLQGAVLTAPAGSAVDGEGVGSPIVVPAVSGILAEEGANEQQEQGRKEAEPVRKSSDPAWLDDPAGSDDAPSETKEASSYGETRKVSGSTQAEGNPQQAAEEEKEDEWAEEGVRVKAEEEGENDAYEGVDYEEGYDASPDGEELEPDKAARNDVEEADKAEGGGDVAQEDDDEPGWLKF